jgi:putative transcriptional regulator
MTGLADSIKRGLQEAITFAGGSAGKPGYAVHIPATVDVKGIRAKLGMSQQEFAGRFGFSVNTLRHWEQGTRIPEGSARAYLLVIARAPDEVEAALRAA